MQKLSQIFRRRRNHFNVLRLLLLLVLALNLLPAGISTPPVVYAAACSNLAVTRISSPTFFTDIVQGFTSDYAGYTITNNSGAPISDLWVKLQNFSGAIGLASNEDGIFHAGSLAPNASIQVYFYLTDTSNVTTGTGNHDVALYATRPDLAGAPLCANTFSLTVYDDIAANANKITATVSGPNPPTLGGIMIITVVGETGVMAQTREFAMSPASASPWPANAFQLTDTHLDYWNTMPCPDSNGGVPASASTNTYDDTLDVIAPGTANSCYRAIYTFVATGMTTQPTNVKAVNHINSGSTNMKHTGAYPATVAPVQPPINTTVLSKSANPASLPTGGTTIYAVVASNSGSVAVTLDSFADTLPAGTTYVAGTSTYNGVAIADPVISGQTLQWIGLFDVPASASRPLRYQANIPATPGLYTNSVTGKINVTQIDTTLATGDNAPATAQVQTGNYDLALSQAASPDPVIAGNTLTYTLVISNLGNVAQSNVTLTDTLPAGFIFGSATLNGGTCGVPDAGGTLTCTLASSLAAGAVVTATITGVAEIPGAITNSARVSSPAIDTTPANNYASITTTANPPPPSDLTVNSSHSGDFTVGTNGVYTITVTNSGIGTAIYPITVTDTLPAGLGFVSGAGNGWSCSAIGQIVTCSNPGPLGVNATSSFILTVSVATAAAPAVTNTVSIATQNESDTSNNTASDVTQVQIPPPTDADMTMAMSGAPASVTVGDPITYTIVITNAGPAAASGVVLTDTLPAGVSFVAASTDSGPCSQANGLVTCSTGNLANNQVVTATVVVIPQSTGTITNSAIVSANEPDPNPGNNTAQASTTVNPAPAPDLSVSLTGQPSLTAGVTGVFTLNVTNNGTAATGAITVTGTLPSGISLIAGSGTGWTCSVTGSDFACTNSGPLAPAQSSSILLQAGVTNQAAPSATISVVANTPGDPNTSNNSATLTTPVELVTDLGMTMSGMPDSVTAGDPITYTIVFSNSGPSDATGVVLNGSLSGNVTIITTTSTAGTCTASGGVDCTPGNLAVGEIVTVTIVAVPTTAGSVTAVATLQGNETDPNTSDNTATVTTTITAAVTPVVDLVLSVSDGTTTVVPGQIVTYTLVVSNAGNQDLTGILLSDQLPANTAFIAASAGGIHSGNTVTWPAFALGSGSSVTYTLAVMLNQSVPAGVTTMTNTANVQDDGAHGAEATPADNIAQDSNTVNAVPDLELAGNATGPAIPSTIITYTYTYSNAGNQDASGVVLQATIPANTSFAGPANWTCAGQTCTSPIGTLAAGTNGAIPFAVRVNDSLPAGTDTITATASITDDGGNGTDPTPGNNSVTITTSVNGVPDLGIQMSASSPAMPGRPVTFTLTYSNTGTRGATGVILSETLPDNTTFSGPSDWTCVGMACSYTVGALPVGTTQVITFVVIVNNPLPAGVTTITNTAEINDDESNGPDANPANNIAQLVVPVNATSGLAFVKSDGGITATPGGTISYTLAYTNTGTLDLAGVVLTETVPANTTFDAAASSPGWSCANGAPAGSICTLSTGNLAAGVSGERTFMVTVNRTVPAGTTLITNAAAIASGSGTAAGSQVATSLHATSGVAMSVDDGGITAVPGGIVHYTLQYSNTGTIGLTGVVLTETVPANTTFNAAESDPRWSCAGSTCTLPIGNLAAAQAGTIRFAVNVNSSLPAGVTQLADTAVIGAATGEHAQGSDTTPVNGTATLVFVKSDGGAVAQPGRPLTYTLSYTNTGNVGLVGIVVTETVPANTTILTAGSSAGWSCAGAGQAGQVCTFSAGNLNAGMLGKIIFVVLVNSGVPANLTQIANTALIGDASGHQQAASVGTQVAQADLATTITTSQLQVIPGTSISYTITIRNAGPDQALQPSLTITLPNHTTFGAITAPSGFSCTTPAVGSGGVIYCTAPVFATGTVELGLLLGTDAESPDGTVVDLGARITAATPDPVLSNNTAASSVTLQAGPPPPASVPEPTTIALLGSGLAAIAAYARRRRAATR